MDIDAGEQALPQDDAAKTDALFMVGIGSSAGGLEAIRELVKNLPLHISATYVIVQHMSPEHKSMLTALIARETSLPVFDVVSGTRPEANVIYVTPPNHDIVLKDGLLELVQPRNEHAMPKPSIDRFFDSAAATFGERSVGIVLSGTGSDGSIGVRAVRAAGGITIAQDAKTAKYDGMPLAAVETGLVDLVLSPIQIATHLERILSAPRNLASLQSPDVARHPLSELLQIVLARTRVDFREYKPSTIQRRIERRMMALGIAGHREYTKYCRSNPREVDALFKDLLISVTRFFRDPNEFFSLMPMIRKMVEEAADRTLRIWIIGCATGEEAYSIAILFAEALGGPTMLTKDRIQIFATDIDADALEIARKGQYPRTALNDIPEQIADRYFSRSNEAISVHNSLKEVIVFSEHNLCQDPPFLNLDLICCRNLLIYFIAAMQRKVLSRLHYSLALDGALFLGTAETVSVSEDLFKTVSREAHLYRKRYHTNSRDQLVGNARPSYQARRTPRDRDARIEESLDVFDRAMFDSLAAAIGPNALLFADDHRIVRVYGDVSRYLSLNDRSRLQFNASVLLPQLAQEVRTLVTVSLKRGERRRGVAHRLADDDIDLVQMEAYPLKSPNLDEEFALVTVAQVPDEKKKVLTKIGTEDGKAAKHIEMLEFELNSTREELQQTIEELETANEELQATNEELQSTNEELQATNEELETSNEELQSTNEELVTVNEELQVSTTELTSLTDEQDAVINSVASPLLVIDLALQVVKANTAAAELFNIRRVIDRPHLSQISTPQGFPHLAELCNESLHLGKNISRNVLTRDSVFSLRFAPYSNQDGQLRGATMIAIERNVQLNLGGMQEKIDDESALYYAQRDADGMILNVGVESAKVLFGAEANQIVGKNIKDFLDENSAKIILAEDREFLTSEQEHLISKYSLRFNHLNEDIAILVMRFRLFDVKSGKDTVFLIATTVQTESSES